jgi:general secretion pathway protein K
MQNRVATRNSHSGFILVATLVGITIIALAAAFFASEVDRLRDAARLAKATSDGERVVFSAREKLLFAATSGTRDEAGVSLNGVNMRLDNTAYELAEGNKVSIQDERGLIAVNTLDEAGLARALSALGVRLAEQPTLVDSMLDYVDADDFKRLNGAERREHVALGLPPPSNDFLRDRKQLRDVAGWAGLYARLGNANEARGVALESYFEGLFSASRHFGINLNTAPRPVLAAVGGIDPARIDALIAHRNGSPLRSLAELAPFTNGPIDQDYVGLVPGPAWRLSFELAELPFLIECQLVLSPGNKDRPARITYCNRRPKFVALNERPSLLYARLKSTLAGTPDSDRRNEPRNPNFADQRPSTDIPDASHAAPIWLVR